MVSNIHYSTSVNKIAFLKPPSRRLIFILGQGENWKVQKVCRIFDSQKVVCEYNFTENKSLEDVYSALLFKDRQQPEQKSKFLLGIFGRSLR